MGEPPVVIMLAGPNGAGKTTTALTLFRETLKGIDYVNADVIAQGLSGTDPDSVALEAGALMLKRLHHMAEARLNIAFETTGASRSFATWFKQLKSDGYRVTLYYFWLPSADMAIARVAERVRTGGHNVPVETIRRRYDAGLRNFFQLYRPLADVWEMIDNSRYREPRRIAAGKTDSEVTPSDGIVWDDLVKRYSR